MTLLPRRILGVCVAAAGIGLVAIFAVNPASEQTSAGVRMTVIPMGHGSTSHPHRTRIGLPPHSIFSGIASWYGDVFDGRRTANGEIFDQDAMTACHRTLPFGTLVRVINLRNRHSVIVRINDRGVLTPERVIDLSSAAAEKLGMRHRGLAPVRLEVVTAEQASAQQPELDTHHPG